MQIQAQIRERRQAAGLNQATLARRAGLTRSAVSLLEKGSREPSWSSLRRIAIALRTAGQPLPEAIESALGLDET